MDKMIAFAGARFYNKNSSSPSYLVDNSLIFLITPILYTNLLAIGMKKGNKLYQRN